MYIKKKNKNIQIDEIYKKIIGKTKKKIRSYLPEFGVQSV